MKKYDERERQMLIVLLNQELVRNPNHPWVLQIIQADESHLIVQNEEDCNLLFNNIDTMKFEPVWGALLNRYKSSDAWKTFIGSRPLDTRIKRQL